MIGLPLQSAVAALAMHIRPLPAPQRLLLDVSHHRVVVADGLAVARGTLLAEPATALAVAVHAPLSGRVQYVGDRIALHVDPANGEAAPLPPLAPDDRQREHVGQRLRACGVRGMGGAGFPLHAKLDALGSGHLQLLIVNAAECDPLLASDRALLRHRSAELAIALQRLHQRLGPSRTVLALKAELRMDAAELIAQLPPVISVEWLPNLYPAGSERQLVAHVRGTPLAAGTHPTDVGVLCINVATALAADAALHAGVPLVDRLVTVSGDADRTGVWQVPFGTPLAELLPGAQRVRVGGRMMGRMVDSPESETVSAATTGVDRPPAALQPEACIRCGDCLPVCPERLPVENLWRLVQADDHAAAESAGASLCIGCGACDAVCPSHLPLAATFGTARAVIATRQRAQLAAERARQRHQRHSTRLAGRASDDRSSRRDRLRQLRAVRGSRSARGPQ